MPTLLQCLTDYQTLSKYLEERLLKADQPPPAPQYAQNANPSAVLAPIVSVHGAPHLLFTKRSSQLHEHRGEISFPGGHFDEKDPNLLFTALREAEEEIALRQSSAQVLGLLNPVFTVVTNYLIYPFVAAITPSFSLSDLTLNQSEVESVFTVPIQQFADPSILRIETRERMGMKLNIHFYHVGQDVIWGATGRMVADLMELLPKE